MSESPDTLAQQIAALEAALKLVLPEESRRQLLANLQAKRVCDGSSSFKRALLRTTIQDIDGIVP